MSKDSQVCVSPIAEPEEMPSAAETTTLIPCNFGITPIKQTAVGLAECEASELTPPPVRPLDMEFDSFPGGWCSWNDQKALTRKWVDKELWKQQQQQLRKQEHIESRIISNPYAGKRAKVAHSSH